MPSMPRRYPSTVFRPYSANNFDGDAIPSAALNGPTIQSGSSDRKKFPIVDASELMPLSSPWMRSRPTFHSH